jgi:hypothetical protein
MWTNNKRTPIYIKKNLLQTHLYLDLDVIVWSLYRIFFWVNKRSIEYLTQYIML